MPPEGNVILMQLTAARALEIIRGLAGDSSKIEWTKHALQQMKERHITTKQVRRCLEHGQILEGPARSANGNWEMRMETFSAGEPIAVALALDNDQRGNYTIIITSYRL